MRRVAAINKGENVSTAQDTPWAGGGPTHCKLSEGRAKDDGGDEDAGAENKKEAFSKCIYNRL